MPLDAAASYRSECLAVLRIAAGWGLQCSASVSFHNTMQHCISHVLLVTKVYLPDSSQLGLHHCVCLTEVSGRHRDWIADHCHLLHLPPFHPQSCGDISGEHSTPHGLHRCMLMHARENTPANLPQSVTNQVFPGLPLVGMGELHPSSMHVFKYGHT